MKNKQAIQLSPKKRTKHIFQKLKMCKKCNRYSVLQDDHCYKCGAKYTGIERLAKSNFKNKVFTEAVSILIVVCIGIFLAPTVKDLYLSMSVGVLFCLVYVIIHTFFVKSEYLIQLKNLIKSDLLKIKRGLHFDNELAKEDIENNNLGLAYEKLRETGDFIDNNTMRLRRVSLLNQIIIRKDMELELESLVPTFYSKEFTSYALEAMKVNRSLATKHVFTYFITNKEEIEQDFGTDALVTISSAALRMKLYILEYKDFIVDYIEQFPKERLLRLCSILHANPTENWDESYEKTKNIVKMNYDFDPDFKSYF